MRWNIFSHAASDRSVDRDFRCPKVLGYPIARPSVGRKVDEVEEEEMKSTRSAQSRESRQKACGSVLLTSALLVVLETSTAFPTHDTAALVFNAQQCRLEMLLRGR